MMLGLALFVGLFNNLALFIILVAVYGILNDRLRGERPLLRQLALGLLFALVAVGCMQVKIPVHEGVQVDQRNAIVILAGAFGGPLSALVAAAAAGAYRVHLGGLGIYGGILGVALAAIAGSLVYRRRSRIDTLWKAALAAIASTIFVLPGFLPIGSLREGLELLAVAALPYGSAIAIGVLAGGLLLWNEERRYDAQARLRESEAKYRTLFESLIDLSWKCDADGRLLIVSPSSLAILGYSPEELVGTNVFDLMGDSAKADDFIERLRSAGSIRDLEADVRRKDGSMMVASTNARAYDEAGSRGFEGVTRDITRLKLAEALVKASLAERESLLMELYHRTNNNMQLIASLLKLRTGELSDAKVEAFVAEMCSRIQAMSLVYEKLSRSESLSRIGMRDFVTDLVSLIAGERGETEGRIHPMIDVEDAEVVIDSAIPLALVINEIVSNSYEYAFAAGREGTVRISLWRQKAGEIALRISDDGVGFPSGFNPYSASSFGIRMVLDIVRLQMRGSVEIYSEAGVEYRILLRDDLYGDRVQAGRTRYPSEPSGST